MENDCLIEELEKFIGKELFLTLSGQDFRPKGILKSVNDMFIVLNDERILINSIASFKPAETRHFDSNGVVRR